MITLHHHHNIFCWFPGISAREKFPQTTDQAESSPLTMKAAVISNLRQMLTREHLRSRSVPVPLVNGTANPSSNYIYGAIILDQESPYFYTTVFQPARGFHIAVPCSENQISSHCNHLALQQGNSRNMRQFTLHITTVRIADVRNQW